MASGSRGKKVGVFLKNLPHKLRCDRCEINVVCPKVIKEYKSIETQVGAEDYTRDISSKTETISDDIKSTNMSLEALVETLDLRSKAALLSLVLKSEAKNLWIDQENACLPPSVSLPVISTVEPDKWLQQRHPLLLAIAFALSMVITILTGNISISVLFAGFR